MTTEKLMAIRNRLNKTTIGIWQRSYFYDKSIFSKWSPEARLRAIEHERKTIRGTGTIGTPECNIVLKFEYAHDDDIEFIANAKQDIMELLKYIDHLEGIK